MGIEFAWFYSLKALVILVAVAIVARPFYKSIKEDGILPTKNWPYIVLILAILFAMLSPVKIDNGVRNEATISSFDRVVDEEVPEIETYEVERYNPSMNEIEIKRIMSQ